MDQFVHNLFQAFRQHELCYCLLRDGASPLAAAASGELDLLVDGKQLGRLEELLSDHGFVHLPAWGHWPHRFYLVYLAESDRWLKLDVVTDIAYGRPSHWLVTPLAAPCLEHRRELSGVFVPAAEDELLTLLLHCVLDKRAFTPSRYQRLQELAASLKDRGRLEGLLKIYRSDDMPCDELLDHLAAGHWDLLLAEYPRLVARLTRLGRLRSWRRRLGDPLLRKAHRVSGWLRPRSVSVALVAPDGAGKSTVIESVRQSYYGSAQTLYMGLYQKRDTGRARWLPKGLGLVGRLATQWKNYLKARYHQSCGRLVLFDRYSYDALLPTRQQHGLLRRLRRKLLAHTCPGPDLVVMLDAPGEVLFARKGEHSVELLEQQRQSYLAMRTRIPQMVVVDATQSPEAVRRDVTSAIWRRYGHRLHRSQSA